MKWIAAAGVALFLWLGMTGPAAGAELVKVTPDGFLQSDLSNMASPPGDGRIFLVERGNTETNRASIRILDGGAPITEPFLTIDNVDVAGERGVMSLAFAPDYASSGLFYVFTIARSSDALDPTGQRGDIRIVEYRRSATDPGKADPASARLVLETNHSASNHNGGFMEFGPDGYLYLSIGDNANRENARDPANLFGKIMRIDPADPDGTGPARYSIPDDNPVFPRAGARREIFTIGLRNPYRGSFAPDGRLTIGDVGEGTWEEINAGDLKGRNLGWPECEGFCFPADPAFTDPIYAYDHAGDDRDCAVVGGHVVEDESVTDLVGRYIFADFCGGVIRSIDLDAPGGDHQMTGLSGFGNPVAFGQDARGCSYVLQSDAAFRIVSDDSESVPCPRPLEPPPVPDITYQSFIPNRSVIGRFVAPAARCSIACTASASVKIRISRNRYRKRPTTFRLPTVIRSLTADVQGRLVLRVPMKRVKGMKRAVRNGSRVFAFAVVRMVGEDSSGGSGSKSIRLVRPKRR